VCEWLEWRAANGRWKEVSWRKALGEVDRRGLIMLPAAQQSCLKPSGAQPPTEALIDPPELGCTLEELGEIKIMVVTSRYASCSRLWNALMERFHYLGKGPLCGAQMRYLVESARYGYRPVWVETFVDPSRFGATCYRAANWVGVGQSAARSTAYQNGKVAQGRKDIYLYPLSGRWQEVLCAEPEVSLCSTARAQSAGEWTEEDFSTVQFFDERLKRRLFTLAADFFA
jgi:hypothetical protein